MSRLLKNHWDYPPAGSNVDGFPMQPDSIVVTVMRKSNFIPKPGTLKVTI